MSNFIGSPKMWDGIMGGRVKFVTATLLPVVYVVGGANSCYSLTHTHTQPHMKTFRWLQQLTNDHRTPTGFKCLLT